MMLGRRVAAAGCAAAILASAACSSPPVKNLGIAGAAVRSFDLVARVAMRNGADAFTAKMYWQHGDASDRLEISSPFGQQVAMIYRDHSGAELTAADGAKLRAASVEELTERHFGIRVPMRLLPGWVLGRPGADAVVDHGESGRINGFTEDGWRVDYLEYSEVDTRLPTRIQARREPLSIRLAVDEWTINPR
jgi:outer membrane lipoprotein LolB